MKRISLATSADADQQEAAQLDPIVEVQHEEPVDEQQQPPLQLENDDSQWETYNTSTREGAAPARPSDIRGNTIGLITYGPCAFIRY